MPTSFLSPAQQSQSLAAYHSCYSVILFGIIALAGFQGDPTAGKQQEHQLSQPSGHLRGGNFVEEVSHTVVATMNIFRLSGDMTHLLSILVLLLKIRATRSCRGEHPIGATVCVCLGRDQASSFAV
jgi:hypothetical protein